MARYIDADKMVSKDNSYTTFPHDLAGCDDNDLVRWINEQPSADVVPKSEVERLQGEAENLRNANADLALALLYECEPTKEHLSELEKAVRDKVAREIFEEFDKAIDGCETLEYIPTVVLTLLVKLKKKYIGGEENR